MSLSASCLTSQYSGYPQGHPFALFSCGSHCRAVCRPPPNNPERSLHTPTQVSVEPNVSQQSPSAPSTDQSQVPLKMENIPTVVPADPFDARADADALHKAMKGLGTDEEGLIDILCRRTSHQRVQIVQAYKASFGKDLTHHLEKETSGDFEDVLKALCKPTADFMADEIHDAIQSLGTKESTLIEILCSRSNQEIRDIVLSYRRLFESSMEEDIEGDTSGTLKRLLISLAQGGRNEDQTVDFDKVREDVQTLYNAGEGQLGTDESVFNRILATGSWAYIRQVMEEYEAVTGNTLESAVKSEFTGYAEDGLLAILKCAKNRPAYLAERLHKAMSGCGTKDRSLIRLIVSRSDIDLGSIKQEYENLYEKPLSEAVAGDVSGDYERALLTLIG